MINTPIPWAVCRETWRSYLAWLPRNKDWSDYSLPSIDSRLVHVGDAGWVVTLHPSLKLHSQYLFHSVYLTKMLAGDMTPVRGPWEQAIDRGQLYIQQTPGFRFKLLSLKNIAKMFSMTVLWGASVTLIVNRDSRIEAIGTHQPLCCCCVFYNAVSSAYQIAPVGSWAFGSLSPKTLCWMSEHARLSGNHRLCLATAALVNSLCSHLGLGGCAALLWDRAGVWGCWVMDRGNVLSSYETSHSYFPSSLW
jgi:hypothetical protein